MKTFDVHIDLGNEAMSTPHDVADTLERLSQRLRQGDAASGKLADLNGNTVGGFGFDLDLTAIHEPREQTDLERAFDAASYNAALQILAGRPGAAREYADAAAAIGMAIHGPRIDRLELHDGDTLIVQCYYQPVTSSVVEDIAQRIRDTIVQDVRVLVLGSARLVGVAFSTRDRKDDDDPLQGVPLS